MQVVSVRIYCFLPTLFGCPWDIRKKMSRLIISTQSAFIWWKDCKDWSSISWDIRLNMPVFCRVVPEVYSLGALSTSELLNQSLRKLTQYRGNAHIEIAISYSVSEWQIRGVCHFFTKLVAMAMYLEISEKEVQIDHLHPEHFYSVKRLQKLVQ